MEELRIEYLPVDSIFPYANNARKHGDTDVDAIMASIREFGFRDPIGIWKGIIVEGHGRLIAAKRLGMETVPVIRLDDLTDEQRRAYALAHNKTAELSQWDFDVLQSEIDEISIDMTAFGFEMNEDEIPDEAEPEPEKMPLPESRMLFFSVSAFGTESECFLDIKLTEEQAERVLKIIEESGAEAIRGKLEAAVDEI